MSFETWLREAVILLVDDDPGINELIPRMLIAEGFQHVEVARCPRVAAETFRVLAPDLVLLDYHMPQVNGLALLEEMKASTGGAVYVPIVMMTGDMSSETRQRALVFGAEDVLRKPVEPFELVYRIRNLLRTRYLHLQLQLEKERLEQRVEERIEEARRSQVEILERLAVASEYRDDETAEHTRRVGLLAGSLALRLGLDAEQAALVRQAAQLHDVGKIGVSDEVLMAPGRLSREQFDEMKQHTIIGMQILSGGSSQLLLLAEDIASCHHERWDGTGYPNALKGDEIPLAARIVAVADFFDALTHDRRYRAAVPAAEVMEMIREGAGTHFDPDVVGAFLAEMRGRE
ncbi:MAG TPA: HD domain-containing phosphohydrolase [Longimicrobiaceae bacterium]